MVTQHVSRPRDRVGVQGPKLVTEGGVGDEGSRSRVLAVSLEMRPTWSVLVPPLVIEVIFVMINPDPIPLSLLKAPPCIPRKPRRKPALYYGHTALPWLVPSSQSITEPYFQG